MSLAAARECDMYVMIQLRFAHCDGLVGRYHLSPGDQAATRRLEP